MRTRPLRRVLLILVRRMGALMSILVFLQGYALAQDDPNQTHRIYNYGNKLVNIHWANDSLSLVYQEDYGVNGVSSGGNNSWNQYSVVTHQTVESDTWPLQPSLTPTQQQTFEFYTSTNPFDQTTFAFYSPNLRYIVYLAQDPRYTIGVADLQTGNHQILDEAMDMRSGGLYYFDDTYSTLFGVEWNANSNGFALITMLPGLSTHVHYVDNLNNLTTPPSIEYLTTSFPEIEERDFFPTELFDLSPSGNLLLLSDGYPHDGRLIIWNRTTQSYTLLPASEKVAGATFLNEERILFVDADGLKQYHVPNNHIALLNPTITSTWAAGGAYFSPNGQYVAIYNGGKGSPDALYLFDLGGIPTPPNFNLPLGCVNTTCRGGRGVR